MQEVGAPPRFEDVVASVNNIGADQPDTPPHWGVTFAVDDADAIAEHATKLGGNMVVGVVIFLILVAIFGPWIVDLLGSPPNEFHQNLIDVNTLAPKGGTGVSAEHLFGVEPQNGRDIFSRVVYGARISLLIAFLATVVSVVIGATLGIVSGYLGGWVDAFISRAMDVFLAFPLLVFAIALAGVIPDSAFGLSGDALRIALLIFIITRFT